MQWIAALMGWLLARWHDVLDLFAPHLCLGCGEPYPSFPANTKCFCAVCHESLEACESESPLGVIAPYLHGGALARAIHQAKYAHDPCAARKLGTLLPHAIHDLVQSVDVVLPVPLHPRRHRSRGYNQSLEIARALQRPLVPHAVARVRDAPRQVGLGRVAREHNMRDAFKLVRPDELRDRRVLLLDDVTTTGATLHALKSVVALAKPRDIVCVALAQAP